MLRLLAGAALIAMAAVPLHAQPGKNDNKTQGKPAAAAKANGNGNAKRGGPPETRGKPDRGTQPAKAERANGNQANPDRGNTNRGNGGPPAIRASDKGSGNSGKAMQKGGGPDGFVRKDIRDSDYAGSLLGDVLGANRGLIAGCPPGLAKKRNGCLPPGQAKQSYRTYRPGFFGFGGLGDGRYYLNDGYLLRYGDSGLAGFIPLLAGALSIGNIWPNTYQAAPLPDYYVDYYRLGTPSNYRYADEVIYRVDPETAAISSVAAILTGDDFVVGQPMPAGYDVYNVPYAYRDRYYDTPDARYRYADGYVYRIDPETALITAAIDLLI